MERLINKNSQSQPRGGKLLSTRWWHMLLIGCLISCGLTAVKAFDSPTPSPQPLAPVAAQGSIGVVAETAYVSLTSTSGTPTNSQLYRVNLNTGSATLVGDIGPAANSTTPPPAGLIRDIAVAPGSEMGYAINANNVLLQFRLGTPGTILSKKNITGLMTGDVVKGMDFRMNVLAPGNVADQGKLYVFGVNGVNGRIYTVDLITGIATLITTTPLTPLSGTDFGFDFNPLVDRIRIVGSGTGSNLRANPNTGNLVQFDTALNGAATSAFGSAYTNNFTGVNTSPAVTTLYATDTTNLYLQGSINGTPNSPNGGLLTTVGALGVSTTSVNSGFDIASGNGMTAASLPNGTLGFAYAGGVRGTGGTAPFTFALTGGTLPTGLTLSTTGQITGTPTQSGSFTVTIQGTDSSAIPLTNTSTFSLTIAQAPVGLSTSTGFATFNSPTFGPSLFEVNLSSSGPANGRTRFIGTLGDTTITDMTFSLNTDTIFATNTAGQLVSFNRTTPGTISVIGTITGLQPSEVVRGIDFRPASVTSNQTGGQLFALGSTGRTYVINTTTAVATQVGTTAVTLTGTDFGFDFNPTVDRLRVVATNRQDLRINPENGVLAATDGTLTYASGDINVGAIPAVNGAAYTNSFQNAATTLLYDLDTALDVTVTQNPPNNGTLNTVGHLGDNLPSTNVGFDISNSVLYDANVGAAYSQTIVGYGGVAPYTFTVSSGSLPTGLSLTPAGVISGTPTTSGSFTFAINATDNFGSVGSRTYTVNVTGCGTFAITPASLPNATVGQTYPTTALTATGGTGPYTFAVTSGSFTPGLRLSSAGVISGTPTSSGLAAFTITAIDSTGCQSAQAFSMQGCGNITLSALPTTITRGLQPIRNITATGGAGPYTFFVAAGSLPSGLTLSTNGQLSGIVNTGGTFQFTIAVLDRLGCVGQRTYTITVR